MTATEFYNSLLKVTKKTGQGLPGQLFRNKLGKKFDLILEILKEKGLIKIVTQKYSYLPDDEWVCLSQGYCVEENYNPKNLFFLRNYLGINDNDDIFFKNIKCESNVDYDIWLKENKELLEETQRIQPINLDGEEKENLKEYFANKKWFKENYSTERIIKINNKELEKKQKISSILDDIIALKKIGKKDYTKEKTELEEIEQELIKRQELNLLLLKNKNKQIQEIL